MNPHFRTSVKKQILSLLLVMVLSLTVPTFIDEGNTVKAEGPATRANGPIVNLSQVDIVLYEGYGQIVEKYFNGTGYGTYDLFYDPNDEWDQVPYPNKPFEVEYPSSYTDDNTPVKVKIERDPFAPALFGKVTITENVQNWNNIIYGQEWYVITIIARNGTGSSTAEVRFKVYDVNDRPERISDRDFFSIEMDEDTSFSGINGDNDPPNLIFGDPKDPFDIVTYSYEPMNELATHIAVEMGSDGSYITFTPEENWACPYIPSQPPELRLQGPNYKKPDPEIDYFAYFRINCSDDAGLYLPPNEQDFYVYVGPVNDPPEMEDQTDLTFMQDELAVIDLSATDLDLDWEQELVFGTNLTTSIYDLNQEQIEFQEEYIWEKETGHIEFMTSNDLVGIYPVSAFVQDKSSVSGRPDYPATPYKVWGNFTLNIENINDGPRALIDQPLSTFVYNTSSMIEFNALRSLDIDITHGDILNYTWTANGNIIGYGPKFYNTLPNEGTYNITVNVTDLEGLSSEDFVDINVVKARIPGEIFIGQDIDRGYTDNNTAIVIRRTTDEINLIRGGQYGLDIASIEGKRSGAVYSIRIDFTTQLDFLYTSEIQQDPILELYFLTSEFEEATVEMDPASALDYMYPLPPSNVRYKRLKYDLRGPTALSPSEIIPLDTIRILDTGMGVEITLTVVEMDDLGIKPDFELYAVASMDTVTKDVNGQLLEQYKSWDSTGLNTKDPIVDDATDAPTGNENGDGLGILWVIIIILVIIIIIVVAIVIVFLITRKKDEEPDQVMVPAQVEQSVDEMVFGDAQQQYPDAQQMYGQPAQQTGELPQGQPAQQPEGLPQQQPELLPPQQPVQTGQEMQQQVVQQGTVAPAAPAQNIPPQQ